MTSWALMTSADILITSPGHLLIIRTDVRKVVQRSDKGKWPLPERGLSVDHPYPRAESAWRGVR